ncbi:hypothetical protein [Desulfobacca acetoxidans]
MSYKITHIDQSYTSNLPDFSFNWTWRGKQFNYNLLFIDILIVFVLKVILIVASFGILNILQNINYYSFMVDQHLYFGDIQNILKDPSNLFAPDQSYLAVDTLYSRVVGFLAIPFWFLDTYLIAVTYNMILSILIAIFTIKLYYHFIDINYLNPRILFYILALSPTFNAYSLLILRDIMIAFFFTLFIYYLFKDRWFGMICILGVLVFLRPFIALLLGMAAIMKYPAQKILGYKHWLLLTFITISILIMIIFIIGLKKVLWPLNYLYTGFDLSSILKIIGLGFFIKERIGTGLSTGSGMMVRLLTTDSVILPLTYVITIIPCFIKGNNNVRIFLLILFVMNFIMAIAYLGALRSFPSRKILMLVPLFYVQFFYFINNHILFKKNRPYIL